MWLHKNLNVVILSGVAASRSEAAAQSKDPYPLDALAVEIHANKFLPTQSLQRR
jgi:hypothetical protein